MTALNWFSKTCSPLKTTKRLALFALTGAALLWLAPAAAAKDAAPDWLRAAAQEKISDYPKDTKAVILLEEMQITVQPNGDIETRHRSAIRLLRPEAREDYGGIAVDFDNETKISYLKAWTITSDGHEIAVGEKDAVEHGLFSDLEYNDVRVKALQFPEAYSGNVVGYEYLQRQRPEVYEDVWGFQRTEPVRRARLSLLLPPGWEFSTLWGNYPEERPRAAGPNEYVWEMADVPAIEIEPAMPPWTVIEGHMIVKYFPRDPAMRSKTTGSWTDIGLWYESLIAPRRVATPPIKAKVSELTAGMQDPLAKIRALAAFSQREIRYMAVEIGIGGHQPHAAGDVFTHRYGDCKDKATLLNTMLQEIGIQSYNVMISPERGTVRPDFPLLYFGHSIVAIRLPDTVTDASLFAVVNDPRLGRLLFFDPTNEYVPLGYLPSYLQDNDALVVTPDGGKLLHLPLLPPSTNRLLRTAKFSISPTGDLSGEIQELLWGGPAAQDRERFLETKPSKRAEIFERFLGRFLTNFTLTAASLGNLNQYDDTLTLHYTFSSRDYAKAAGDLLVVSPRVVGDRYTQLLDLFTVAGKPRKYPIEFDEATRQDDMFDIALPAGYVADGLPKPVQVECPYATYRSETKVAEGVLHYTRTFEVKDVMVPAAKLPEIRSFLQEIAADQRSAAILRRVTP